MSLRRSCRAISSAASRLVRTAVSSLLPERLERAELTSMAVSASVWSIEIVPPDLRSTTRL